MKWAPVRWLMRERGPVTSTVFVLLLLLLDASIGIQRGWSEAVTLAQTLLVLPWAVQVFRLEPKERLRPALGRLRIVAVHLLTLGLVALCLVEKGIVLRHAYEHGSAFYVAGYRTYSAGASAFFLVGLFSRGSRLGRFFGAVAEHPARLMAISFGLAATLGGFALTLPQSLLRIGDANFVDGFFTATSAVCVTGLSVNDLARTYTFFGQAVIVGLVQMGGLGIMVLSSFFGLVAGTRMRVRSSAVLAEMLDAESLASIRRNVVGIVLYTLAIEVVGGLLLYASLVGSDVEPAHAHGLGWTVVFHTVSAFSNAGFALFDGNFAPFVASWPSCTVLSALVVVGGLGFPVLDELGRRFAARLRGSRPNRLSLHTRVVLSTSAGLIAFVALAFLVLEWNGAMKHLPWHARVLSALFQSISTRSGGFATLDYGVMSPATLAIVCVAMFIGGSPGSSAGGIKTTTFAILLSSFRAELRGERSLRLFDRTPPEALVRRAIGVTFLALSLLSVIVIGLFVLEHHDPLDLVFEAVSAFATVGLSTGITASLSPGGKLLLAVAMFIGRIGPLTFALAFTMRDRRLPYALPEERVSIG